MSSDYKPTGMIHTQSTKVSRLSEDVADCSRQSMEASSRTALQTSALAPAVCVLVPLSTLSAVVNHVSQNSPMARWTPFRQASREVVPGAPLGPEQSRRPRAVTTSPLNTMASERMVSQMDV